MTQAVQFVQVLPRGHESWNLNLDLPVSNAYACLCFIQPTLVFLKSGKMAGKSTPELLPNTITSVGSLLVCLHLQRHFFFSFQEKHTEIRCWYESLWRPLSYQDTLHLGAPRVRLTLSRAGVWICPHHLVNRVCSGIWHVLGKENQWSWN